MKSISSVRLYCERIAVAILLLGPLISGCSDGMGPHPVDAVQARSTLEAVLQSWQDGATPESWKEKSPSVVVQDMDWRLGKKLTSFEILEPTQAVDANLHCRVKLTLEDPESGAVERTVKYVVGTDPVLTVFRSAEG
ncbi:MAG: hypothetical protein DWQ34_21015 [Planctomycetota bacterium]|nr:MAG: hypothetical protein DWQ34_21015 [Planctomycetota bacterium]